jgi:hypothetical protein
MDLRFSSFITRTEFPLYLEEITKKKKKKMKTSPLSTHRNSGRLAVVGK